MSAKTSRMFEKYNDNYEEDHKINLDLQKNILVGNTQAKLIKTITDRPLGVSLKAGNAVTLYFSLQMSNDELLAYLMTTATFGFEILDKKHNIILSAPVNIFPDDAQVSVDLISERNGLLNYGNYYMHLYILFNGIYYSLFNERDGILSVD